jgi:FkbM family methyltransferase
MPVTTYKQWTIHYTDEDELNTLVEEIFKRRIYYVDLDTSTPLIIDAGAHIGLPTLYFHSLYPKAKFILFEPNPDNVVLLRKNLEANDISNVEIVEKALIGNKVRNTLHVHDRWSLLSSLHEGGWTGEESMRSIEVETTPLAPYLEEHVSLLKMDIEGMETEVLEAARNQLPQIGHLIVEFHRTKNHNEEKLLKILRQYFHSLDITVDERHERNFQNRLLMIEAHH